MHVCIVCVYTYVHASMCIVRGNYPGGELFYTPLYPFRYSFVVFPIDPCVFFLSRCLYVSLCLFLALLVSVSFSVFVLVSVSLPVLVVMLPCLPLHLSPSPSVLRSKLLLPASSVACCYELPFP